MAADCREFIFFFEFISIFMPQCCDIFAQSLGCISFLLGCLLNHPHASVREDGPPACGEKTAHALPCKAKKEALKLNSGGIWIVKKKFKQTHTRHLLKYIHSFIKSLQNKVIHSSVKSSHASRVCTYMQSSLGLQLHEHFADPA